MRLVVHHEIQENDELRRQWNALVQSMECPEVFYTYEWALALSRGYKSSIDPLIMLAYDGKTLVGIAALALDEKHENVSFLAGSTADFCDFISEPNRRAEFISIVLHALRQIAPHLVLPNVPANSMTIAALPGTSSEQSCSYFSRPAFQCGRIDIPDDAARQTIGRAMRKKQTIRRRLDAMAKEGSVEVQHLTEWPDIFRELHAFRDAHLQRFYNIGRTSNLADSERWDFLLELARLLSAQGWMTLSRLTVSGQSIAWAYGFKFSGSWFYYQPTFDMQFSPYNPGLYLLCRMVEDACNDSGIRCFDLGLGDEGYKKRFANAYRETVYITLTASVVHHVREKLRYHAVSAIKSVPSLEHWVRWVLGKTVPGGAGA